MTIALRTRLEIANDKSKYPVLLEERAVDINNCWEDETTAYTFEDGSVILDTNGELS